MKIVIITILFILSYNVLSECPLAFYTTGGIDSTVRDQILSGIEDTLEDRGYYLQDSADCTVYHLDVEKHRERVILFPGTLYKAPRMKITFRSTCYGPDNMYYKANVLYSKRFGRKPDSRLIKDAILGITNNLPECSD